MVKLKAVVKIYKIIIIFSQFLPIFMQAPPFNFDVAQEDENDFSFLENKVSLDLLDLAPGGVGLKEIDENGILRTSTLRPLVPIYYRIKIRPLFDPLEIEFERFTVPGTVTIQVDCISNTRVIQLHSKFIEINGSATKIFLKGSNLKEVEINSQSVNDKNGLYVINTQVPLEFGGTYEITLEFTAKVFRDRLNGLYLSNYTNPSTKLTEYLVVTHFEPQGARQLFPCFDEPDMKANFEISIGRREDYNSLCNTELIDTTPIRELPIGWYWDNFKATVKMSTYLVAIVVSKYTSESADSNLFGGKSVKVWAANHFIEKGGCIYAAQTAATILQYYESYFKAKYPLSKMDSVAIPHFEAGAMENYGLNTYREKYLIYFDRENTEAERYGVCSVIGHELAHQWFGDLVTCKSWSQLWLNEGFAAYVQNMGANKACPEFEPWNMFVSQTMQVAMQYDQSLLTHPIVNETDNTAKFTKITYNKGASLLRMTKEFLSEATFQKGLQNYLEKLAFGNAHQDDLFAVLDEQARKDETISNFTTLSNIMEAWTLKKGFPLVRVTVAGSNSVYLSQEEFEKPRYLRDRRHVKDIDNESQELWWIPVKIITKENTVDSNSQHLDFWIPNHIRRLERNGIDTNDWLIVNPEAIGYYRVLYDEQIIKNIKIQLEDNPKTFSSSTRSQLLDDYFNLAFSNYINVKEPLELTTYLDKETEYNVWTTVLTNMKRSLALLSSTPAFPSLQAYLQPKLNSALNSIGFEQPIGEKGIKVILRSLLLDWSCSFKDTQCQNYTLRLFKEWMTNPDQNNIPVDIQGTIYCTALRNDLDNSIWNFVMTKYTKESTGRHKNILLNSLTCSKNTTNTKKLLQSILTTLQNPPIGMTEVDGFLKKMASTSDGRKALLQYMRQKPQRIFEIYKSEKKVYGILRVLGSYVHAQHEYQQIQRMFEENSIEFSLSEPSIQLILDLIDDNRTWISKYYEPMKSWFEGQLSPSPRKQIESTITPWTWWKPHQLIRH